MDRRLDPVQTPLQAKTALKRLQNIEKNHFGENTSRRWSIEFSELYHSLEKGLYQLEEQGDIAEDPSEILTAADNSDYSQALNLLNGDEETDSWYDAPPGHRRTSPTTGRSRW